MIELVKNYFIEADNYNYILKQRVVRKAKKDGSEYEGETTVDFSNNIVDIIKMCVKHILMDNVQNGEVNALTSYIEEMKSINKQLNDIISPLDVKKLSSKLQN